MDYDLSPPDLKTDSRWAEEDAFAWSDPYRSPQDRRRRGRSRSPIAIDRYQPVERDREYYGASRDHAARDREQQHQQHQQQQHSRSNIDRYIPGQDSGKPVLRSNPIPSPLTLDYQVGFNYYAEWWRTENAVREDRERARHGGRRPTDRLKGDREAREDRERERTQIQSAYDTYKQDLQVKLARQFVQLHRGEEWFREKYVPEIREPFRQRLARFRVSAYTQWTADLAAGVFDDFTLEGIYKSESDGAGGIIEKEEGEATAVGETLGVLDLVPARGGDLRDDSILQPALLIKTLAPNVSREKIEEFSREHLGEADGGFKWLSLSDPNPSKKYHRIGWIMLHPSQASSSSSSSRPIAERGDGRGEEGEEDIMIDDADNTQTSDSSSAAQKALEAVNGKTISDPLRGDFVCHVGVHVPPANPRKKALWDLFSAPERIERDLELARRVVAKFDTVIDAADGLSAIDERVEDLRGKGWLQPPVTGPLKQPSTAADEGEDGEEPEPEETDTEDLLAKKKTLDIIVEYLRRVHNFCLYCVFESDSIHELSRKCPGGHLRRPRSGLSSHAKAAARASVVGDPYPKKDTAPPPDEGEIEASPEAEKKPHARLSKSEQQIYRAFNWVRTFEEKLTQLLDPESVDLTKIGGKPVDEALEDELARYVKQEDESKFRCKVPECTKLFKAMNFWRKHVEKRHGEWLTEIRNELSLVNAYALDPAHIAPTRSDAASNGHFPFPPGHMPAGTPRGFNYNMSFIPPNSAGFGIPPSGAAGLLNGSYVLNDASMHQGVIRRGGGRYANRYNPYDRRGGGRHPAADPGRSMFGRVSVPGAFPAVGAGQRWDSAQAMGPKEAVQGRSLKSYEDLDAVSGAGSGELNY